MHHQLCLQMNMCLQIACTNKIKTHVVEEPVGGVMLWQHTILLHVTAYHKVMQFNYCQAIQY